MCIQKRPSPTIEDYLGVIYTLTRDGEHVIGARLADYLGVSPSTVTATLKRMTRDGWVKICKDKEIILTKEGMKAGASVIRRHMLTEWMLSRVLKLPLSQLHREAHQIEHTISPEVEERLQLEMQDPTLCPHGNPLPGFEDEVSDWMKLSKLKPGDAFILRRIHEKLENHYESLSFLEAEGLIPGTEGTVIKVLPFNETIHLSVNEREIIIGLKLARHIYVTRVSTA